MVILLLMMLVSTSPIIAATDNSGAIGGFSTSTKSTYQPGLFIDLNENQWYGINNQAVIQKVYELEIMNGKGAGIFDPNGNITIAEAIKMAAVVHNIYNGGQGDFIQGTPWYQVYVDYAVSVELIVGNAFSGEYTRFATRAEMAYIFANCVPRLELQAINSVVYLPDVYESDEYGEGALLYGNDVFSLFRAGVLTGNDNKGTFRPFDNITRAEAAAIICRIVIPSERKILDFSQVMLSGDFLTQGMLDKYDSYAEFIEFSDEDYQKIIIMTNIAVSDFKFIEIEFLSDGDSDSMFGEKRVVYALGELSPEKPFVVTWMGWGMIPHRGVSFVDEKGATRYFAISVSGLDGSLIFAEF